ncbi:MAG TPA: hypothetical protein VJB12_05615, partial [Candidatus Nanoarchaeia archaeon]|nr:hypothetical protein [Candidatus Nanoarchaeia archaeon]
MMKNWHIGSIILLAALFAMLPIVEAGETRIYLNDTKNWNLQDPNPSTTTLNFTKNLTLDQRINSSFIIMDIAQFVNVEYLPSDGSNQYLLRFRINYGGTGNSIIEQPNCTSPSGPFTTICSSDCGAGDFANNITYRIEF